MTMICGSRPVSVAAREAVEGLAGENETLLGVSRDEARTDALTGLGKGRARSRDLAAAIAQPPASRELLLSMLDLDRFKQLQRHLRPLGRRRAAPASWRPALRGRLTALRLGRIEWPGDEFCLLARCRPDGAEQLLDETIGALQDNGDGWHVGCSQGADGYRLNPHRVCRGAPQGRLRGSLRQAIAFWTCLMNPSTVWPLAIPWRSPTVSSLPGGQRALPPLVRNREEQAAAARVGAELPAKDR